MIVPIAQNQKWWHINYIDMFFDTLINKNRKNHKTKQFEQQFRYQNSKFADIYWSKLKKYLKIKIKNVNRRREENDKKNCWSETYQNMKKQI